MAWLGLGATTAGSSVGGAGAGMSLGPAVGTAAGGAGAGIGGSALGAGAGALLSAAGQGGAGALAGGVTGQALQEASSQALRQAALTTPAAGLSSQGPLQGVFQNAAGGQAPGAAAAPGGAAAQGDFMSKFSDFMKNDYAQWGLQSLGKLMDQPTGERKDYGPMTFNAAPARPNVGPGVLSLSGLASQFGGR